MKEIIVTEKDRQIFKHALKRSLHNTSIDVMSKSLAASVFRNGLIEDYHVSYKITDADMKRLNKDVVNRIATMLRWLEEGKYTSLHRQLRFGEMCTSDWDDPEEVNDMPECEDEIDQLILLCKEQKLLGFQNEVKSVPIPNKKQCFTLTEAELEQVIINITENTEYDFCVIEDNNAIFILKETDNFVDFDLIEVINNYYGIEVLSIHQTTNEQYEEPLWWIEYIDIT